MAIKFLNSVNADSGVLYVDADNNRVGIGTTSPASNLDVNGDTIVRGRIYFDGTTSSYIDNISNGLTLRSDNQFKVDTYSSGWQTRMLIADNGKLSIPAYGSGTNTGTLAYALAVDSSGNIIESTIQSNPAGVDGIGTVNYLTKWLDGDTLTDSVVYDDGTNVGIGSTNPTNLSANTNSLTVGSSRVDLTGGIMYQANGTIKAQSYWDSTGWLTYVNSGSARWYTGGSERMRLNSDGSLSFSITSNTNFPSAGIKHNSNNYVYFSGGTNGALFGNSNQQVRLQVNSTDIEFLTGGTTKVKIASNGNVGIGTTSPDAPLTVTNNAVSSYIINVNMADDVDGGGFYEATGGMELYLKDTSGTGQVKLTSSGSSYLNGGNVGIGTTSPATRLDVVDAIPIITLRSNNDSYASLSYYSNNLQKGLITYHAANNALQLSHKEAGTTSNDPHLVIKDGNVGIGTASPGRKLHVVDTNPQIKVSYSTATDPRYAELSWGGISVNAGNSANAFAITMNGGNSSNGHINFFTGPNGSPTEKMRITQAGNVGIGTTNPSTKLQVVGDAYIYDSSVTASGLRIDTGTANLVKLRVGYPGAWANADVQIQSSTASGLDTGIYLKAGGNVGIGTTNPGSKLHLYASASGATAYQSGNDGLTIERGGRVAINLLSPTASDSYVFFGNPTAGNAAYLGYQNTENRLVLKSSDYISLLDSTGEVVRVDGGNVGIGTTSPNNKLDVDGNINSTGWISANNYISTPLFYNSGDHFTLNKAGNGWLNWADRNNGGTETVIDLAYIGTLSTSGSVTFSNYASGLLQVDANGLVSVDTNTYLTSYTETQTLDNVTTLGSSTDNSISVGGLEIFQDLSAAETIDYPLVISSKDDNNGINQLGGEGVGIKFRIAGNDATDPGNSLVGASIAAIRKSSSDTESDTHLAFFTSQNDEVLDEAMRITSDGRVGIGTANPTLSPTSYTGALHVENDTYIQARLSSSSSGAGLEFIPSSGDHWEIQAQTGNSLIFYNRTDGSYRLVIDGGGNIGVGTTSPAAKMHIGPDALVSGYTTTRTTLAVSDVTNGAELILRGQSPRIWFDATSAGNGEIYMDGVSLDILSGTPISAGSSRFNIDSSGNIQFGAYGAGLLQTDASGNVSVDTNTYLTAEADTLDSVTDRGNSTSNAIIVGRVEAMNGGTDSGQSATTIKVGKSASTGKSLLIHNESGDAHTWFNYSDGSNYITADTSNTAGHTIFRRYNGTSYVEDMRITSSGNVGIGITSPLTLLTLSANLNNSVTFARDIDTIGALVHGVGTAGAEMWLHRDDVTIGDGNLLGRLNFSGADGGSYVGASILGQASGAWSSTNSRSRLIFETTSDGATSPSEKMRIEDDGTVQFTTYGAGYLKTDANGNITVDSDIIEDTLDSVTDRGNTTTNSISVGEVTLSNAPASSNGTFVKVYSDNHKRMYTATLNFSFTAAGTYNFNLVFPNSGGYQYELTAVNSRNGLYRNFGTLKDSSYIYWESDEDFTHRAEGDVHLISSLNGGMYFSADTTFFLSDGVTDSEQTGTATWSYAIVRYSIYLPYDVGAATGSWKLHLTTYGDTGTGSPQFVLA